ncbi:hypothetical protein AAG906_031008 [Vitis piasezkii]
MDSIDFDSVKLEKANAMRKYHTLRKFANFLRVLEVSVALFIMLFWSSKRVSNAVKIFSEYLRELCVVLANPRFMFLIGNAIIITLFVKSGRFSGENPDRYVQHSENSQKVVSQIDCAVTKVSHDDDFVKHSESQQKGFSEIDSPVPATSDDKQIVCWENALHTVLPDPVTTVTKKVPETKFYRRTKSATIRPESAEKPSRELRRSETDKFQKMDSSGGKSARRLSRVEELSNEEFRRKVEAFIEKQQRLLREENVAIVLSKQN